MPHFVDRRLNPKNKSLGNRQRLFRRVREQIKQAVDEAVRGRGIADIDQGETVSIPTKGIVEPTFRHAPRGGQRGRVFTGNRDYRAGDRVKRPPPGEAGGAGREGASDGEGEDDFRFSLSREEFLDFFFEDLELPNLVKRGLKQILTKKFKRAGYARIGSPANINLRQTMRNSLGRRLALKRPSQAALAETQEKITVLESIAVLGAVQQQRLTALYREAEEIERKRRRIAYIDPLDVRYNNLQPRPEPNTHAVMFCLMDVSASMGEREKDLAKRFFALLHLFLKRRYDKVELVFIRHTHESQEVDEETFFYSAETGGTVVSTALTEMKRVIQERYPASTWNIYGAQASDGENFSGDSTVCKNLLHHGLMPVCQHFAYIEILDEREAELMRDEGAGAELWRSYRKISSLWPNFAMKRISRPADIYPVFRELFTKRQEQD